MYHLLVASDSPLRYLFQVIPIVVLVGGIYLVRCIRRCRKTRKRFSTQEIVNVLFVCYLTGLIALTLVPNKLWTAMWFYIFNGYPGCEIGPLFVPNFNFIPTIVYYLKGTITLGSWVREMLSLNLLMFVPMGIFLPLVSKKIHKKNMIIVAMIVPLVIELIQPILGRSFDVDDIIMNALGIIFGWCILSVVKHLKKTDVGSKGK